jgi:glutamine amidotransferase
MSTATDVAIVDNGGANIASLCYALERIGAAARLVSDPRELGRARRVILPGVGAAGDAMRRLESLDLVDAIRAPECSCSSRPATRVTRAASA